MTILTQHAHYIFQPISDTDYACTKLTDSLLNTMKKGENNMEIGKIYPCMGVVFKKGYHGNPCYIFLEDRVIKTSPIVSITGNPITINVGDI